MKILFMNDRVYAYASRAQDAVGGAERQQWYLARALARSGWNVVVGMRGTLKPGERREVDGVEFAGIPDGQIFRAWHRFLQSERPNWWYWRGAGHLYGTTVALSKVTGVGTIFSAAFDRDMQPRRALSRRRAWWPLYAWGLAWNDRIVVQHRGQLCALPAHWRSKAQVVPSMAGPVPEIRSHQDRTSHVAWVAMLRQPKRPDILIEIARRLPHLSFVVCGGPSQHRSPQGYGESIASALQSLPNVRFLGQVAPETVRHVIADAALLLSTSDEEGFPNTFLEAWSSGTPVVSLNVDPDDHIQQNELGTVSRTVDRLAADIEALVGSPRRRDEIAVRAREHVARAHSETVVVSAFERAVQGVRTG